MASTNDQLRFGIGFDVDKSSLSQVTNALKEVQSLSKADFLKLNPNIKTENVTSELSKVTSTASQVQAALEKAFNPKINSVNLQTFQKELHGLDIKKIHDDFAKAGVAGENAFRSLTAELLTTKTEAKQTHKYLDSMMKTLTNTVKWSISSAAINTFSRSVQEAYGYVKALDGSLNDIQIVTQKSAQEMAKFADQANNSAKQLGTTTTDYTDAALTFYQQGLSDKEVKARTDLTMKVANTSGLNKEDAAEYVTAVLNGYKVGSEEAEAAMDVLANVGAHTASSLSELSEAMSKVSSTASSMGVSEEQLASSLATVIQTTRQDASQVGTAFKTIYMRISDIAAGTADAEVSLGKYTGDMAKLGYNVLDNTGHLRDLGDVMEEIGGNWANMSREQQIALARTMAGTRQANNLLALFDNWSTYGEAMEYASTAQGTLQTQQDIYMESTSAHLAKMKASWEDVYDSLLKADNIDMVADAIAKIGTVLADVIDGVGGLDSIITGLGGTAVSIFSNQIAKSIMITANNFKLAKQEAEKYSFEQKLISNFEKLDNQSITALVESWKEVNKYANLMTAEEKESANNLIKEQAELQNIISLTKERQEIGEKYLNNTKTDENDKKLFAKKDYLGAEQKEDLNLKLTEKINQEEQTYKNLLESNKEGLERYRIALEKVTEAKERTNQKTKEGKSISEATEESNAEGLATLATMEENLKTLGETINLTGKEKENFDKMWQTVQDMPLDDPEKIFKVGRDFQALCNQLISEGKITKEALADMLNGTRIQAENNLQEVENCLTLLKNSLKQAFTVDNIIKTVGAVGQLSSAFMSLSNIPKIWSNENLSEAEKMAQTISALVSVVTMGSMAFKTLNSSMMLGPVINALTVALFGQSAAATVATGATVTLTAALKALFLAIIGNPIALAIVGMIAAIGAAFIFLGAKIEGTKTKLQELEEQTKNTKNVLDDATNSLNDLTSAWKTLTDSKNSLKDIKKGTMEWYEALNKANDAVMAIIEKYPELAQTLSVDEDGLMSLDEDAVMAAVKQAAKEKQTATLAYQNSINMQRAEEIRNQNSDKSWTLENKKDLRSSAQGGNQKTVLDGSQLSNIAAGFSKEQLTSLINKASSGTLNARDKNFEKLQNLINEYSNTSLSTQDILKTITSNTNYLNLLLDIKNNNEKADKIQEQTQKNLIKGHLQENSQQFKGLDNSHFEDMVVNKYQEGFDEVLKAAEKHIDSLIQSGELTNQQLIDKYNKAMHTDDGTIEEAKQWAINKEAISTDNSEAIALMEKMFEMREGMTTTDKDKRTGEETVVETPGLKSFLKDEKGKYDDSGLSYISENLENLLFQIQQGEKDTFSKSDAKQFNDQDADFMNQFVGLDESNEKFKNLRDTLNLTNEETKNLIDSYSKLNITEKSKAEANEESLKEASQDAAAEAGLDPEQVEELAKAKAEEAQAQSELNDAAADSAEIAADLAVREIELNDAVEHLYENWSNYEGVFSALEKGGESQVRSSTKLSKAYDDLKETLADLTGVSEEYFTADFIDKHSEDIKKAAEGDEKAVKRITKAAQKAAATQLDIDNKPLLKALEDSEYQIKSFSDMVENIPEGEIRGDNKQFIQTLINSALAAGMKMDEIESTLLKPLGIDVDTKPMIDSLGNAVSAASQADEKITNALSKNIKVNSGELQSESEKTDSGFTEELETNNVPIKSEVQFETGDSRVVGTRTIESEYAVVTKHVKEGDKATAKDSAKQTVQAIEVESANKSSVGGKINPGNKKKIKDTPSGGNGNKGKKSSPKKSSKKKTSNKGSKTAIKADRDPYHNVNNQIARTTRNVDKLKEKRDKLYGKDIIKNLEQQTKEIQKQLKLEQQKLKIAENELKTQRSQINKRLSTSMTTGSGKKKKNIGSLQGLLNKSKLKINFDENGEIVNYNEILTKLATEINKKSNNKKAQDKFKEAYDQLKEYMDEYEETLHSIIPDTQDAIESLIYETISNNIEAFNLKIEAQLDLTEAKKDLADFKNEMATGLSGENFVVKGQTILDKIKAYTGENGTISYLKQTVLTLSDELKNIDAIQEKGKGINGIYAQLAGNISTAHAKFQKYYTDEAKALEDNQNYFAELQSAMTELHNLILDFFSVSIESADAVAAAYGKVDDTLEQINSNLEHQITLTNLLYGEKAYDKMSKYYQQQLENSEEQLKSFENQFYYWAEQISELNKEYNADLIDDDKYEALLTNYAEHWEDALDKLNGSIEDKLEVLNAQYENAIRQRIKNFINEFSNDYSLDAMDKQLSAMEETSSFYLDDINKAYKLQKLQNQWNDTINGATSVTQQKALSKAMQDQLDELNKKDKLTEKDIERAQKAFDIEQKRYQLEEARNNKTQMRLVRDAAGNYAYQFVADSEAVSKVTQELRDAQNELYNFDKETYLNNLNEISALWTDFQDEMAEAYITYANDQNELERQKVIIQEKYQDQISAYSTENAYYRSNLEQTVANELTELYDVETAQIEDMTELIPQWGSEIQKLTEEVSGDTENITENIESFIGKMDDLYTELNEDAASYSTTLDDMKTKLEEIQGIKINFFGEMTVEGINNILDKISDIYKLSAIYQTNQNDEVVDMRQEAEDALKEVNGITGGSLFNNTEKVDKLEQASQQLYNLKQQQKELDELYESGNSGMSEEEYYERTSKIQDNIREIEEGIDNLERTQDDEYSEQEKSGEPSAQEVLEDATNKFIDLQSEIADSNTPLVNVSATQNKTTTSTPSKATTMTAADYIRQKLKKTDLENRTTGGTVAGLLNIPEIKNGSFASNKTQKTYKTADGKSIVHRQGHLFEFGLPDSADTVSLDIKNGKLSYSRKNRTVKSILTDLNERKKLKKKNKKISLDTDATEFQKMLYALAYKKDKDKKYKFGKTTYTLQGGNLPTYFQGGLADFTGPAWLDGSKSSPELVLNSSDTKNLLSTVEVMRDITKKIAGNTASIVNGRLSGLAAAGLQDATGALDQNVYITATFEGQTEAAEIQTALQNLINIAAQRAQRN